MTALIVYGIPSVFLDKNGRYVAGNVSISARIRGKIDITEKNPTTGFLGYKIHPIVNAEQIIGFIVYDESVLHDKTKCDEKIAFAANILTSCNNL